MRNAPELFDQDDEHGLVVVLGERPSAALAAAARQAVDACPSGALSLVDDDSLG